MSEQDEIKTKKPLFHRIINWFLYTLLTITAILLLVLGFTQTSTFREMLREQVLNTVNSSIAGKINIAEIDGTIFTSLILREISLTYNEDTIAAVNKVDLRISPLRIFLKKIYVRSVEVSGANIRLVEDSLGVMNISKAFPSEEDEDTTSSEFPFTITLSELNLIDLNFSLQTYKKIVSTSYYDSLNMEDFRINNLNLSVSAYADINENEYELEIKSLSLHPNLNKFKLKNLAGKFIVNRELLSAKDFLLETETSKIGLTADWQGFNLFGDNSDEDMRNSFLKLKLDAERFNFDDLTTFVDATDILRGEVATSIEIEGKFSDIEIKELNLNYLNTSLGCTGRLLNLDDPSKLFIKAQFLPSILNYPDISSLLPSLELPELDNLSLIKFDTLYFEGEPLNFKSNFAVEISNGNISGSMALDLGKDDMIYNADIRTVNLDLQAFSGMPLLLNSSSQISGIGTSPERLIATAQINIDNSIIGENRLDNLRLESDLKDGIAKINASAEFDSAKAIIIAEADLTDFDNPQYEWDINIKDVNLERMLKDSLLASSFNINFSGKGSGFDPEKINALLSLKLENSNFQQNYVEDFFLDIHIKAEDNEKKRIKLFSSFADLDVAGNFKYEDLTNLILLEIDTLTSFIAGKIDVFLPTENIVLQTINEQKNNLKTTELSRANEIGNLNLKYELILKDYQSLPLFLGVDEIQAEGILSGSIEKNSTRTSIDNYINIDFAKNKVGEDIFFITNLKCELNYNRLLNSIDGNDITFIMDFSAERLFANTEIKEIDLKLNLSRDSILAFSSADITEDLKAKMNFSSDLNASKLNVTIDRLLIAYNRFELINKDKIYISFFDDKLEIKDFNLYRNDAVVNLNGFIAKEGRQDLRLSLKRFKGYDIGFNILQVDPQNIIDYDFNLDGKINGDFENPNISINISVDNLTYGNRKFGLLQCGLNYANKYLNTDIHFADGKLAEDEIPLSIVGKIPVDLSLAAVEDRLPKNREVDLKIIAKNFNLETFGDAFPFIDRLKGILTSDLVFGGTLENLDKSGSLTIREASFVAENNNLEYGAGIKLRLEGETLYLDSLLFNNMGNVRNKGTLRGRGKVEFQGLNIASTQFLINGDLTVLSTESKAAIPEVFGDLFIATQGDVIFASTKEKSFLRAYMLIKEANLIFPQTQSGYSASRSNFVYKFIETEQEFSQREIEIEKLIRVSKEIALQEETATEATSSFDYDFRVKIEDEARITFMLAQAANQKLNAELKGELKYEKSGAVQNIQGELQLLEGSTLEFIKTFSAKGTIKFESDITNPNLDIVATYTNYLTTSDSVAGITETEVAVKIKLKGTLDELSKNFTTMEDNIAVYEGAENIRDNKPSPDKDKSDAVWFILTGKFANEVTSQDKQDFDKMLGGTATSLAGSLLGGLLNTYFGDLVRTFEVRTAGTGTKFSLSGSYKGFRYTVGASTSVFNDLSAANIRVEYPLLNKLFIRLERKEAISETNYPSEMINELGLKYRFEF